MLPGVSTADQYFLPRRHKDSQRKNKFYETTYQGKFFTNKIIKKGSC